MKKYFILVFLILAIFANVYALEASAGFGAFFNNYFSGGFKVSALNIDSDCTFPSIGGGVYTYVDLIYVEMNVGASYHSSSWNTTSGFSHNPSGSLSTTSLDFALYLKYPIDNNDFIFSPMAGVLYHLTLLSFDKNGKSVSSSGNFTNFDLNYIAFNGGLGVDINMDSFKYLRIEALYGIRLSSDYETKMGNLVKSSIPLSSINTSSNMANGLTIRLAIGFYIY